MSEHIDPRVGPLSADQWTAISETEFQYKRAGVLLQMKREIIDRRERRPIKGKYGQKTKAAGKRR